MARNCWQEGLSVTRASGDRASEAIVLGNLGRLEIYLGNYGTGRTTCEESLTLARQLGDEWVAWGALYPLALAALVLGDLNLARGLAHDCIRLQPYPPYRTHALYILGQVANADGAYTEARAHLSEALVLSQQNGDPVLTAQVIEALSSLLAHAGRHEVALRLLGAAEAAWDQHTVGLAWMAAAPQVPVNRDLRDRWLVPLRARLSAGDADRWLAGAERAHR
jgi:tetratricopeptide (TPR) repeat protein